MGESTTRRVPAPYWPALVKSSGDDDCTCQCTRSSRSVDDIGCERLKRRRVALMADYDRRILLAERHPELAGLARGG
jgi:hypothetical protein